MSKIYGSQVSIQEDIEYEHKSSSSDENIEEVKGKKRSLGLQKVITNRRQAQYSRLKKQFKTPDRERD